MSLLLDALKRAEQEKLAKQGEHPANEAGPPQRREASAAAALELQPLGNAKAGAAAAPAGAAKSPAATAQAVFQAKAAAKEEGARNHTMIWIVAGVVVLFAIAIGGYVWYQLNSMPQRITTLRPRAAPTPPPASGDVPTRQDTLVPGAIAPGQPRGNAMPTMAASAPAPGFTPPATPSNAPSSAKAAEPASPAATTAAVNRKPAADVTSPEAAAQLVKDAPPAGPTMRLAPSEKPRIPVEVEAGYGALRSGDLAAARRSYAAALAADGSSLDAHLGLATVEARLGNVAAAVSHYRRALDLDPRNATALAALASLADAVQPELAESRLRADVGRHPQSPALHFALGNVYAASRRWEEAQAEYYEAHRLEPAGADILYNLAVSMDHMGQQRLAADYYRRALEAARGQAAQFDPETVARRLAELRP